MQVEKHVGEHAESTIAWRVVVLVAENREENLGLAGLLEQLHLLLGFCREVGLQRFEIFFDAGLNPVHQTDRLAILAVWILLIGHRLISPSLRARNSFQQIFRLNSHGYTGKNEPGSLKWLVCPLGH